MTACAITNRRLRGSIRVVKHVVNDNGGTAQASNFTLSLGDSAGTTFVQAFYTVSDPGDIPIWKSCAGPTNVGSEDDAPAGAREFRCVLAADDQGGLNVTGLGVVANDSPSDPFGQTRHNPNFNAGSDAIRIGSCRCSRTRTPTTCST